MDVKIPSNLAAGDYLLRAEAIALHAAGSLGGAQLYMTCYQLTVTGGGSVVPSGVLFPGAYKATDPGIEINIYQNLNSYVAPGPAVIAGGTEAIAGQAGSVVTATGGPVVTPTPGTTMKTSVTTTAAPAPSNGGSPGGCSIAKYGQCGGKGWTGCTTCKSE